ncbi:N-terminal cleavage protein [Opitutaceae bacterium TAV5]|nr:N-terminal cleavage protein [Opitutaceae bacterium TAV5]
MNTTPKNRPTARRAFTLVELLTVIAIIGVLAAIILPVAGKVRKTARAAHCLSNMRQLGGAFSLYASDNRNGLLPPIYKTGDTTETWKYALFRLLAGQDYTNETKGQIRTSVFACPSDADVRNGAANVSYGMNKDLEIHAIASTGPDGRQAHPINPAGINAPSQVCLLIEHPNEVAGLERFRDAAAVARVEARHDRNYNVLYVDGHVTKLAFEKIPQDKTSDAGKLFWQGR